MFKYSKTNEPWLRVGLLWVYSSVVQNCPLYRHYCPYRHLLWSPISLLSGGKLAGTLSWCPSHACAYNATSPYASIMRRLHKAKSLTSYIGYTRKQGKSVQSYTRAVKACPAFLTPELLGDEPWASQPLWTQFRPLLEVGAGKRTPADRQGEAKIRGPPWGYCIAIKRCENMVAPGPEFVYRWGRSL
jgi:hypothetical protein